MRRTAILLSVTGLAFMAVTGSAQAAAVRDCPGVLPAGAARFEYDPPPGAALAYNVTIRAVACRTARRFIVRASRIESAQGLFTLRGFACRTRYAGETFDIRCTASGGRVIRWQGGA